MNKLIKAAEEIRYLINRGHPKDSVIRFISDHYCLPKDQRLVLTRTVIESSIACLRMAKALPIEALRGKIVYVDGYNVLITLESLLEDYPVYMCDDGFLRDTRGIHSCYKCSEFTVPAIVEMVGLLASPDPSRIEILFDQQISRSGELARLTRSIMADKSLPGDARTARNVDYLLKTAKFTVATSDGNVIDAAPYVVDLPRHLATRKKINVLSIGGRFAG